MQTRYGVWLDGQPMDGLDPSIYITDIQEQAPQMNIMTVARAKGDGLFVTRRARERLSVVVRFAIREYDTARRKGVMQQVIAWAKTGKYLAISDRPGQRLRVEVDAMPTITSALKWTQELSITFAAYALPCWQDEYPLTMPVSGERTGYVSGDAFMSLVDATITPDGDTVTVRAGNSSITLEGVSGEVEISHGDDGILRITSGGASILAKRTPDSSDDLFAVPGQINHFAVEGGEAVFRVRGWWM